MSYSFSQQCTTSCNYNFLEYMNLMYFYTTHLKLTYNQSINRILFQTANVHRNIIMIMIIIIIVIMVKLIAGKKYSCMLTTVLK